MKKQAEAGLGMKEGWWESDPKVGGRIGTRRGTLTLQY